MRYPFNTPPRAPHFPMVDTRMNELVAALNDANDSYLAIGVALSNAREDGADTGPILDALAVEIDRVIYARAAIERYQKTRTSEPVR